MNRLKKTGEMRKAALMKAGYDLKTIVCFACLGPHMKKVCETYGRGFRLSTSLCYVDRKPHGFHTRAEVDKQHTSGGTFKPRLRTWMVRKR